MIKVLYPLDFPFEYGQSIFLAGPIQGARDWQSEAIELIKQKTVNFKEKLYVANPRSPNFNSGPHDFEKQIDWETHFLKYSANNGVIMFWLCNESEHFCERAYAQTTRFELAEWSSKLKREINDNGYYAYDRDRLVIGFDTNFSGTKYIKHRLKFFEKNFCYSLEETINKTIELLETRK